MSKNKNLHRTMCENAAKILHKGGFDCRMGHKYVTIELMTYGNEIPDVWATNGWSVSIVEVKTSRSDFLRDKEKKCRQNPTEGIGNFRWYFAPKGIIKEEELPENWGLAEADATGEYSKLVKIAAFQESSSLGSIATLCSIMRREGIKKGIFNYRKTKTDDQKSDCPF